MRERVPRAPANGIELAYDPGIAVTFQVVDADTGAALTELRVGTQMVGGSGFAAMFSGAMGRNAKFESYPNGIVEVPNLRPKKKQKLTLRLEALGYAPHKQEGIELPMRGSLDLGTIRLKPAPIVEVVVTYQGPNDVNRHEERFFAERDADGVPATPAGLPDPIVRRDGWSVEEQAALARRKLGASDWVLLASFLCTALAVVVTATAARSQSPRRCAPRCSRRSRWNA